MSSGLFRPSVADRMDLMDRLEEQIRVVTPRAWLLVGAQCALLAVVVLWAFFGRLPVNARRNAVCVETRGPRALLAVEAIGPDAVRVGAHAVLEARDGSHRRLPATVAALGTTAPAASERVGTVPMEIALQGSAPPKPGEHFLLVVTVQEESPAAHLLHEWWR